jgi:hypothetical protein
LIIGVAIAAALAGIGVSVVGSAVALAPATERVQGGAPQVREATSPVIGRLSEHQELRRILIDEGRTRLR